MMKNKQIFMRFLVPGLLAITLFSGFAPIRSTLDEIKPTATDLPIGLQDFAGKWLAYKVESLEKGSSTTSKPGIQLEISENIYRVNGVSCDNPPYSIRDITRTEFLSGKEEPEGSIEFYEDQFKILESGCAEIEPAAVARLNIHKLAAIIGRDLIFFEADQSVTEGDLSIVSTMQAETSEKPLMEVHAQIPVLQMEKGAKFNQAVRSMVVHEMDEFKQGFVKFDLPPEMANYRSFMWIGYDVPLLTEELVSIRFSVDYMVAGAAHPNHHFRVFNYDLKHDEPISPDETLMNSTKMLNFLSEACLKSLNKPDFPLFPEGLTPRYENFKNWNLTRTGLRISFDPYMVAPYAAGPQEVIIPYADIKEMIRSSTTVGAFVAQY